MVCIELFHSTCGRGLASVFFVSIPPCGVACGGVEEGRRLYSIEYIVCYNMLQYIVYREQSYTCV